MKRILNFFFVCVFVIPVVIACNIYAPFGSVGTDADRIEEAIKCLHDNDYDCAVEQYSAMSDATEKAQHLCSVHMAQAGLGIQTFVNIFASGEAPGNKALGMLANELIKYEAWSAARQTAIINSKVHCDAYALAMVGSEKAEYANMLRTLSRFVDCALYMGKADQIVTASNDTDCNLPGDKDGKVTAADIANNADGTITTRGMCKDDVQHCTDDFNEATGQDLGGATGMAEALKDVPDKLKEDYGLDYKNAIADETRKNLISTIE